MLPHALFPQISQGLLPVIVKEWGNLLQMMVSQSLDSPAQLFQFEFRLGFAVRMVEDMHQLSDDASEAVYKPCLLSCDLCNGRLCLNRDIGWLLEETPTQRPEL